jgi:hypothetical protein
MGFVSESANRALNGNLYRALLSQAGTAAPTAVKFSEGRLKGAVWARTGVGTYTLTKAGAFLANKVVIKGGVYDQATGKMLSGVRSDNNTLTFKHGIAAGAASDVFTDVPVEIVIFD